MDALAALLLPKARTLPNIRSPVTALYSFAYGQYWPEALSLALWARLEEGNYFMLCKQANGRSFGNMGYIIKSAKEAADQGDKVAAQLVQRSQGMLQAMAKVIKGAADSDPTACFMTPQETCNFLQACADVSFANDHALLSKLAGSLAASSPTLNGQDVSNALYVFGVLCDEHKYLAPRPHIDALCARGRELLLADGFARQGVSLCLYGMAKLRHYDPSFMQALDSVLEAKKLSTAGWTPQNSSVAIWSMGLLRHKPSATALSPILDLLKPPMLSQHVCNALYGLLLMDGNQLQTHLPTAQRLMTEAHRFQGQESASLQQLWNVAEAAHRMGLPGLALAEGLANEAQQAALQGMEYAGTVKEGFAALNGIKAAIEGMHAARGAGTQLEQRHHTAGSAERVTIQGLRPRYDLCNLRASPCPTRQPQPSTYCMHVDVVLEVHYACSSKEGTASALVAVECHNAKCYMTNAPYTDMRDGQAHLRVARLQHAFDGLVVVVRMEEWLACKDERAQEKLLMSRLAHTLARLQT